MKISEESKKQIDNWVKKFPQDKKRSAIIAALTIVQEENNGWLSNELIEATADYLELPVIQAYEIASFYSMFELKPVGKHKICVCTNISCMLRGAEDIVDYLQKKLNIKLGQTTKDGKFSLKEVECLAACDGAPMMQIAEKCYKNLNKEVIDSVISELRGSEDGNK